MQLLLLLLLLLYNVRRDVDHFFYPDGATYEPVEGPVGATSCSLRPQIIKSLYKPSYRFILL